MIAGSANRRGEKTTGSYCCSCTNNTVFMAWESLSIPERQRVRERAGEKDEFEASTEEEQECVLKNHFMLMSLFLASVSLLWPPVRLRTQKYLSILRAWTVFHVVSNWFNFIRRCLHRNCCRLCRSRLRFVLLFFFIHTSTKRKRNTDYLSSSNTFLDSRDVVEVRKTCHVCVESEQHVFKREIKKTQKVICDKKREGARDKKKQYQCIRYDDTE